jgi:hypothetical protein
MGDIAAFFSLFGLGGGLIYLIFATLRRRQQNVMQKHLLDKFSSAHDFAEFLQSPAGQNYVASLSDPGTTEQKSILGSVRLGIVLFFAGGAFFAMRGNYPQELNAIRGVGMLLCMLGVGFLVSALASHFIAKKLKSEQAK